MTGVEQQSLPKEILGNSTALRFQPRGVKLDFPGDHGASGMQSDLSGPFHVPVILLLARYRTVVMQT